MTTHLIALGYQQNWWDVLTSAFMRNALLGGTIVAFAAGLIGYFIIVRNNAFAAHALAHIGLPGATGAVLVGVPVGVGLGVFCVGGALVIGLLGKRASDREVVTGTVLAMATGLGLFFNSLATKSSSTMTNVLFGNLLAISSEQLVTFAVLLALLGAVIAFVYRPLLFASVNAPVAEAKGVPVRALSILFMVLLGLAVTMAVQAVGTLLLFALVVTPAATAIMLTPGRRWRWRCPLRSASSPSGSAWDCPPCSTCRPAFWSSPLPARSGCWCGWPTGESGRRPRLSTSSPTPRGHHCCPPLQSPEAAPP